MIISCVKWGDKFSHEHVNRLYRMCQKNIDEDFKFICYTENPTGIVSNIHIMPLGDYDLENWWWKLCLFEKPTDEVNIFLDLDVVIQHNITYLKNYAEKDKLRIVKAYWKPYVNNMPLEVDNGNVKSTDSFDMNINSSVLVWIGDLTNIWKQFISESDHFMLKYAGIDSYLYFNHNHILNYFPRNEIYSRLYGVDELNYWSSAGVKELPKGFYFEPDYKICIFNGWKRKKIDQSDEWVLGDSGYNGFEHYWN